MPRITCQEPSTGRPLSISAANVGTSFATIADAPDFSVPDEAEDFPSRDPGDSTRAIRPGEIFFLTPLAARNKNTTTPRWVEVQIITEAGVTIACPGRVTIPPNDTVYIQLQGRSLLKRVPAGSNGDRLQVRAEATNSVDVWVAAEEKLSSEHIGVAP
jgi:hypothetical protein